MSRSTPGFSLAAQLREQRAKLRRDARKKVERCEAAIREEETAHRTKIAALTANLEAAKAAHTNLEDQLRGRLTEGQEIV